MDIRKAGIILEALAAGVDPRTGELLPEEHVCMDRQVQSALTEALKLVSLRSKDLPVEAPSAVEDRYINKNGKLNAARPWTQEDDDMLRQLWRRKATMEEMCDVLQRKKRGIMNRVDYLTSIKQNPLPDDLHAPSGISRARLAWSEKDDDHLTRMIEGKESLEMICSHLGRSARSVFARAEALGLDGSYLDAYEE